MPEPPYFPPRSHRRREDLRFVAGAGRYVGDLAPAGAVHLAFVRSPEAHARIAGIDPVEAAASPDVTGVYTAADLDLADIPGDSNTVEAPGYERPVLAREKVRYVGEPVAVVAARSPQAALDGAELVWVDYDSLPVASRPEHSLQDDVLIHEQTGTNVVHRSQVGDVDGTYRGELEIEIEVDNQRLAPTSVEPLAILATPEGDHLHVRVGHQNPHRFQRELTRQLQLEPDRVRVVVPDVGGAFGMKGKLYPEYIVAAALARRLGVPVMWTEQRREHMSGGTHGRGSRWRVRLAGTREGRIRLAEVEALADLGAYPHAGSNVPTFSRLVALGLYDIPAARISTTSVVT
ncbi:MAG: xanthine dehydrogenase family protein molybdopterin-binding subunit, partial [Actinomycetota bacterium]